MALSHMGERALSGPVIAHLGEHPNEQFADTAAWQAHLGLACRQLGWPVPTWRTLKRRLF